MVRVIAKRGPLLFCLAGLLALSGCEKTPSLCKGESATPLRVESDHGLTIHLVEAPQTEMIPKALAYSDDGISLAGLTGDGRLWHLFLSKDNCLGQAWVAEFPAKAEVGVVSLLKGGRVLAAGTIDVGGGALAPDRDAYVTVHDNLGKKLWEQSYGDFLYVSGLLEAPSFEMAQSLYETDQGQILLAGEANVNDAIHSNWLLWVAGQDGSEQRRLNLPGDNPRARGTISGITDLPQKGLLLFGALASEGDNGQDAWVLELDEKDGVVDRQFGGSKDQAIWAAHDDGSVRYVAGLNGQAAWLQARRLNDNANWVVLAHGPGKDAAFFALVPLHNGLLALGRGGKTGPAFALAVDPGGKRLWSWHDSGTLGVLTAGIELNDGRLLLAGTNDKAARLIWLDKEGQPRDWSFVDKTN